jgi:monoamine oxidase
MSPLSRRSFLASAAALAASPALGAVGGSGEVDVVIVGAGAAGIAAARRVAAANRRFTLIEAADRIGGRCATDTKIFGVPYDLGAHWIHNPDNNPLAKLATGKDLNEISAFDLARAVDRDSAAFCRQGYGALLAKLAAGLPVQLSTPVDAVFWGSKLAVDTPKGNILARAVIITVPTNVLTADKIEFMPPLPKRQLDAASKLALGSYDHIALDMPGNPLGLQKDDMVFEQASGTRTAALLANVSGTSLHLVDVAGAFGRELAAKGEPAMVDFAGEWLSSLFGSNAKRAIKKSHVTRWNENPFALGAMSAAGPGNADARKVLMEPLGGKIWFAGEALHDSQWGTVGGAWESGTRAAEAVLRKFGALGEASDDKPSKASTKRKRRR